MTPKPHDPPAQFHAKNHAMLATVDTVTLVDGHARFGPHEVEVSAGDDQLRITAETIVINTGTEPARPDIPGADGSHVRDSTTLQHVDPLPQRLVIVGAGFIGLELDLWRATYRAAARANGAEPDAGRRLRSWARTAGVEAARITSSVWTYADPESCRWWGNSQADRYGGEVFAVQARDLGAAQGDIEAIASGWRKWGADPDAWFAILHVELLAQLPVAP